MSNSPNVSVGDEVEYQYIGEANASTLRMRVYWGSECKYVTSMIKQKVRAQGGSNESISRGIC